MRAVTKRRLAFLAGFLVYYGALWFFWESIVVYPLKLFVVLLHEVSHAAVLVATGGRLEHIVLDPYQGGVTYGRGGSRFLTLSAGYLGSLAWGALMVLASNGRRVGAHVVNGVIGGGVMALTLLFVRNPFGIVFGLLFGAALVTAARHVSVLWNQRLLLTLGLTSCLYAVLDIKSDILDRPQEASDAYMLAELTGIPTLVWGALWIGLALGASFLLFRRAYRDA